MEPGKRQDLRLAFRKEKLKKDGFRTGIDIYDEVCYFCPTGINEPCSCMHFVPCNPPSKSLLLQSCTDSTDSHTDLEGQSTTFSHQDYPVMQQHPYRQSWRGSSEEQPVLAWRTARPAMPLQRSQRTR